MFGKKTDKKKDMSSTPKLNPSVFGGSAGVRSTEKSTTKKPMSHSKKRKMFAKELKKKSGY